MEMIILKHTVLPSYDQMMFVIRGMRNPLNSWDKIDSKPVMLPGSDLVIGCGIGENDMDLMKRLDKAGKEHRKFMRMMPVYVEITAPLYWWKEFDTYKVGTVCNSCSTMHKIADHEFTRDDFSHDKMDRQSLCLLDANVAHLNKYRDLYLAEKEVTRKKNYWEQMIQSLGGNYMQKRSIMLNYEVLLEIYRQRKNHKLDEWHVVCNWIESLPYSQLITQEF